MVSDASKCEEVDSVRVVNSWIDCADSLDNDSYAPLPRVHQFIPVERSSEDVATVPIVGRAEDVSLVPADCTISGDRGMLVLQTAEPEKTLVSSGEGTRVVTVRLCAIVGMAILIAGSLIWLPERQSASFVTKSTQMSVAEGIGKDEARSTTMVVSPVAENDRAVTIEKPTATTPSLPAPEGTLADGTPTPMQVAKSVAKDEVRSTTMAVSPVTEKDRPATIDRPIVTAPSHPAPEGAPASETPKATSESAALAPLASVPVSGTAPPRQLDGNEIAMLIRRGKQFLADGDLTSARLLLQRAATAGSAEATFLVGTTFDPLFMRRVGVVGMKLDTARAREWYTRAAELGSTEASQQLATPRQVH